MDRCSFVANFNPRPPRGGRHVFGRVRPHHQNFNPRPPRGGRPTQSCETRNTVQFQSTPSARRATPPGLADVCSTLISIHALREEGDLCHLGGRRVLVNFNPRPPRGGRRAAPVPGRKPTGFQSTPSARRATSLPSTTIAPANNFNPRPPRGGRRDMLCDFDHNVIISIHALREEGDGIIMDAVGSAMKFQSTPSARRATGYTSCNSTSENYFNPRPPRGGRRSTTSTSGAFTIFQSTPSARRATKQPVFSNNRRVISIHALREEGDLGTIHAGIQCFDFNPRPPRGGRPTRAAATGSTEPISIHALREEGDTSISICANFTNEFQSTPSARRATVHNRRFLANRVHFNPRPPRGWRQYLVLGEIKQQVISIHALREEGDQPGRHWFP